MTNYLRLGLFAFLAIAIGLVSTASTAHAQDRKNPYEIWVNKKWDYAAEGYDVTSYFVEDAAGNLSGIEGDPVKGDAAYSATVGNGTYIFASQDNLDRFLAEPTKFLPQYGGHCAYALGKAGYFVHGDPEAWHVSADGKLYFNLKTSIQKSWFKKKQEYIDKADPRWTAKFPAHSAPVSTSATPAP